MLDALVVVGAVCGLLVLFATRPLLRRLPEPAPEPDGATASPKIPYASLARWSFATGCGVIAAVATGLGWTLASSAGRPLWLVLGTTAVLLAAIDARTTWLPLPLTRVSWALMAIAVGLAAVLGGPGPAVRAAIGAAVAAGLYALVWRLSRGGFGFGDVRFAPLVGAASAAESFGVLLWALLLGSLVGALQGVIRLARRQREPFPYAPAILSGAYLALVLSAAVRT